MFFLLLLFLKHVVMAIVGDKPNKVLLSLYKEISELQATGDQDFPSHIYLSCSYIFL